MSIRKNYRNLTVTERDRFIQALYHVKSSGIVDQFAQVHANHFFHAIHRSSHFLPWHREMLLRFERRLQEFHPDVTIPYWDSTVDRSPADPLWDNSFLGQFNSAWGLSRSLGSATLPTPQQVQTNQGRGTYDAFWPELEGVIHNPPHVWVGGVMASTASPGDPVFYLHHCWIDMLWARWQRDHPNAPFVASGAGVGLNDPLMEWPDRTPANVLDHRALGYRYDTEPFSPSEIAFEAKWITGLYADLLSRTPDQTGLDSWVAARLAGMSLQGVVNGFLLSNEYCTNLLTAFYLDLLGRPPDPAGLQDWVLQLQAGTSRQLILIGFLDSVEYKTNNAPPDQFVESLYAKLLQRASDPVGKQGWIDALAAGASTAEVIRGFLVSEEYCTRQITNLYTAYLGRTPDPVGLSGWIGSMMTGTAFQEIQRGFLVSDEYRARRGNMP